MIKKALKYGATFGIGYSIGAILQAAHNQKRKESHDGETQQDLLWEGEKHDLSMDKHEARKFYTILNDYIQDGDCPNAVFAEDDVKSVRTRLSHSIKEAENKNQQEVTIEINDRERLRLIETALLTDENNPFRPSSV